MIYKHEEPCEGRLSRTVLWEARGGIPLADPIITKPLLDNQNKIHIDTFMTSRYFIENDTEALNLLKTFEIYKMRSEDHNTLYKDNATGLFWEHYFVENDETGEDVNCLRRYPYPETEDIIDIALTSADLDEVAGASGLLWERETYNYIDFRQQLIDKLNLNLDDINCDRISIIYERAQLYQIENKREILNKSYQTITQDTRFYLTTKIELEIIKNKICHK